MPTVHRLGRCRIEMYAEDHPPPPVHVIHPDGKALVAIADATIIAGRLPRHMMRDARAWITANRDRLRQRWDELQERDQ